MPEELSLPVKQESGNKGTIKRIFILALICRLLIVLIVAIIPGMGSGFMGDEITFDDYRYESGAEYYADNAKKLFDVNTFADAYSQFNDWTGINFKENPLSTTALWYWICCITFYIAKTKWAIRILNAIFASIAVVCVYKFANLVCGEKTARRAALILSLLPYPMIFSCFSYKDQLIMLCTFYLLSLSVQYRYFKKLKIYQIVLGVLALASLLFLRGGLSAILVLLCAVIAFFDKFRSTTNLKRIIVIAFVGMCAVVILISSFGDITYKLQYYLTSHAEDSKGAMISMITVNGIKDIYKLPLTYVFSMIMPMGLFAKADTWYSVVTDLNITLIPISVGAVLHIFQKKADRLVYYGCLAYYLICIITSISIFRHYYSLIPINIIACSEFISKSNRRELCLWMIGSLAYAAVMIIYYAL